MGSGFGRGKGSVSLESQRSTDFAGAGLSIGNGGLGARHKRDHAVVLSEFGDVSDVDSGVQFVC